MSKFYGAVGFGKAEQIETSPGVWEVVTVTKKFYGDVLVNNFRNQNNSSNLNDDIIITNRISIVADPYAHNHFHEIKYVEWKGTKWKVTSVEEQYPRLILTLGGVYVDEEQSN